MKDELFNSGGACCADDGFANDDFVRMDVGTDMIDFPHAAQRRLDGNCISQITDRGVRRTQRLRFGGLRFTPHEGAKRHSSRRQRGDHGFARFASCARDENHLTPPPQWGASQSLISKL